MQTSGPKKVCYSTGHICTWVFVQQHPVFRCLNQNVYVQREKYVFPVTAFEMITITKAS